MRTAYEPDAEYVDGHIVERSVPETPHSAVQVRLVQLWLSVYSENGMTAVRCFELADLGLKFTAADIFD